MSKWKLLRLQDLISEGKVTNKRVFVRSDLNVPVDELGNITDDSRIRTALPCIEALLSVNAAILLTSHLGRPKEGFWSKKDSLHVIANRLENLLNRPVPLIKNWVDSKELITGILPKPGQICLLENCRLNVGEKSNNVHLAKKMGSMCDIYVNDAFGTAHRAEATTVGITKFAPISCAGPLLSSELEAIHRAMYSPSRPITAIVAGSKVSTKLTILQSLLKKVDRLIVGGGIANTFLLATGYNIGKSLCEVPLCHEAITVLNVAKTLGVEVILPQDVVVGKNFSPSEKGRIKKINEIGDEDMIMDVGPMSSQYLANVLETSGTIIWNGPIGVFEFDEFSFGTRAIGQAIASSKGYSLAGGGDTLAAIAAFGLSQKIDYISSGGGAFLECLEGKDLPAVCALEACVKF